MDLLTDPEMWCMYYVYVSMSYMSRCVRAAGSGAGLLVLLESFGGFICVIELVAKGAFSLCVP